MIYFFIGVLVGLFLSFFLFSLRWKQLRSYATKDKSEEKISVIVTVQVIEKSNTPYPVGFWFDVPIPWERMVDTAQRVIKNYSFNYSLTGRESGNPLSRGEFDRLRDILLEHGLLRERTPGNRRGGLEITASGRAFFRRWADLPALTQNELIEMYRNEQATQKHANTNEEL